MGLALIALAELFTSALWAPASAARARTTPRAAPVAPLLPRAAVGIGTGVEGFDVLGVEVLIRISVRIFHVDGAITMNTSDLAGIVFGGRFSTEACLHLVTLPKLPAARAAAPRPRPAPRPAALPYVFGLHALLALAVIHLEVVGVVSHAADLGLGPLGLARQARLDLVALSILLRAAAARALPVGVGPGIYSFHVLLLEPRVAVPIRIFNVHRAVGVNLDDFSRVPV